MVFAFALLFALAVATPDLVNFHASWQRPEGTGWIMSSRPFIGRGITATCYRGAKNGAPAWDCDVVGAPAPVADYTIVCPAEDDKAEACVLCVAFGSDGLTAASAIAQERAFHMRMERFMKSKPSPEVVELMHDIPFGNRPDKDQDLAMGFYCIAMALLICTVFLFCGAVCSMNPAGIGMCVVGSIFWAPILAIGVQMLWFGLP